MVRPRAIWGLFISSLIAPAPFVHAGEGDGARARQMERLGRGVVAVRRGDVGVFMSWRLLGTDPVDIAFDVYRATDGGPPAKLNREPITGPTGLVDSGAGPGRSVEYTVRRSAGGREGEPEPGATFQLAADAPPG